MCCIAVRILFSLAEILEKSAADAAGGVMVREYYEKICSGQEVRASLIGLRDALKDEKNKRAFAYLLGGEFDQLSALLKHEDPKVRRNAALILGKMESEDLLPVLFDAYEKEETRFIRADYLKAISEMDYSGLVKRLERRLEQLRGMEVFIEDRKHVSEEMRMLQAMVMKYRKVRPHKFKRLKAEADVILVTNRCQREVTARQIETGKVAYLAGGIRVRGGRVKELLAIRTWSEMLFPVELDPLPMGEPENCGEKLAQAVGSMLFGMHEGEAPFVFRIELKSRLEQDKKGAYIRKISDAMERASGGNLVNSVADYEVEVRLLERKDGTLVPMLKLFTIPDKRFAYRREVVASSMTPVNAALTVQLAKPYLKESAQILDPFCGVGTLLIERNFAVKAGTMYGIDIYGDAIDKARNNTDRAGCLINYINKDFFGFEHGYLFDEVITDMPQVTASKSKAEIRMLYQDFFAQVGRYLKEEAMLILYVTDPQFLTEAIRGRKEYRVLEKYVINEKNGTTVFVVQQKK